jgi:hypothetical protein
MEPILEVENAKALMTEATAWSVMKWLREKKRVRKAADEANAALDQMRDSVKQRWDDDLRAAYQAISGNGTGNKKHAAKPAGEEASVIAKKVKEADDAAYCARVDAEKTFDEADRQLSTSLAREGCRKAIYSWELHEKAIQKAEAVIRRK